MEGKERVCQETWNKTAGLDVRFNIHTDLQECVYLTLLCVRKS